MSTIFWDLETTDLSTVGQILTFAFVEVNENYHIVNKFYDKIKISRLQLPAVGAIMANHIDVLEHQKQAILSETDAMVEIQKYLTERIETSRTELIGFNSNKFDLSFLRTSFIRNGVSPFFGKNCKYRDVLQVARKLAISNKKFHAAMEDRDGKVSLKLQNVAQTMGILEGEQSHDALEDVMLTIELAKHLQKEFGIDVRNYSAYEASGIEKYEKVIKYATLDYKTSKPIEYHYTPLEFNGKYALWLNIDKYLEGKGKDSLHWFNKSIGQFYVNDRNYVTNKKILKAAEKAVKEFEGINLDNCFSAYTCDIECHPFTMSFSEIKAIEYAIWNKDFTEIKRLNSKYASQLYLRHLMANTTDSNMTKDFDERLKKYALYRYGGKLKLSLNDKQNLYREGIYHKEYHSTWNELYGDINDTLKTMDKKHPDYNNVKSLKKFYDTSAINTIAGRDLRKITRKKQETEEE